MSEEKVAEVVNEASGKTQEELEEIAKLLQAQVNHHSQMATKAQGGLEVVMQMINPTEVETEEAGE